jgi:hypothetical protein
MSAYSQYDETQAFVRALMPLTFHEASWAAPSWFGLGESSTLMIHTKVLGSSSFLQLPCHLNALAIVHHLVIQGLVVVVDLPDFQWIITGILNGPCSIRVELVAELLDT